MFQRVDSCGLIVVYWFCAVGLGFSCGVCCMPDCVIFCRGCGGMYSSAVSQVLEQFTIYARGWVNQVVIAFLPLIALIFGVDFLLWWFKRKK